MSGLEAVGAVASALQLGAYTYRALQVLSALHSELRSAPQWIQARAGYLEALIGTLGCIELQHYSEHEVLEKIAEDIYGKTTRLRSILLQSLQRIEGHSFTRSLRILKFTFREEREIKEALAALEQDKSNLQLCIAILHRSEALGATGAMSSSRHGGKADKTKPRPTSVFASSRKTRKSKGTTASVHWSSGQGSDAASSATWKPNSSAPMNRQSAASTNDWAQDGSPNSSPAPKAAEDPEHTTRPQDHGPAAGQDSCPNSFSSDGTSESAGSAHSSEQGSDQDNTFTSAGSDRPQYTNQTTPGQGDFDYENISSADSIQLGTSVVYSGNMGNLRMPFTNERRRVKNVRSKGHVQLGTSILSDTAYIAVEVARIEARYRFGNIGSRDKQHSNTSKGKSKANTDD